jgi:hypothetical protein
MVTHAFGKEGHGTYVRRPFVLGGLRLPRALRRPTLLLDQGPDPGT